MDITVVSGFNERKKADLIILPFWQHAKKAKLAFSRKEFEDLILAPLAEGDFKGKPGETLLLYNPASKAKEKRILLLGLGEKKRNQEETIRRSYAAAVAAALKKSCKQINVVLPGKDEATVRAIAEGICLRNYAFDQLKSATLKENPTVLLSHCTFIGGDQKTLTLCKKTATIVEGVNLTRDLANNNADVVTPQYLGQTALKLEKAFPKIKVTLLGRKEIEKKKMGLLLAVNQGSAHDPALIVIEYRGNPRSNETTALVGKGITFDTGGLNLKPTGSIETMKLDMSGAATVMGTLHAAAALNLKVNLIGVMPATDNAIGSRSYKPGDVHTGYLGKSVEIVNTDAEGRLILADALAYVAKEYKPKQIIDLATLTGSIVVAIGEDVAGLFSNHDALAKALFNAGEATGERLWRMPLYPEYKDGLKSSIADIKNCGDRKGGSITAAIFLKEFVEEIPWAHIDIAGTAHRKPKHYDPTEATGMGVRLLIEFLEKA